MAHKKKPPFSDIIPVKQEEGVPAVTAKTRATVEDLYRIRGRGKAEIVNDYFTAGTLVVWDVDPSGGDVVRVYRASDPDAPKVYRRVEVAEAEPDTLTRRRRGKVRITCV